MANARTPAVDNGATVSVRRHYPRQDAFRSILAEALEWKPFAAFPGSVRLAVVIGDPSTDGPYTIRVRVPDGMKLMPHGCGRIALVPSSCFQATRRISIGRCRVTTSPRFHKSGRSGASTWTLMTNRETRPQKWQSCREAFRYGNSSDRCESIAVRQQ